MIIPISNDPITGFARRAVTTRFMHEEENNRHMTIEGRVEVLYQGEVYKTTGFSFSATDNFYVDAECNVIGKNVDGEKIPYEGYTVEDLTLTEYECYNSLGATSVYDEQRREVVLLMDSMGRM